MNSREIRLRMKSFEQKIARTNYHVEFYFDDKSKIDFCVLLHRGGQLMGGSTEKHPQRGIKYTKLVEN